MANLLTNHNFLKHLFLFITFNIFLYLFIIFFHTAVPFSVSGYHDLAHHFLPDPRITSQPFNLLSALAQYDSQWYLKIAASGYRFSPADPGVLSSPRMGNLTFAFFPLYPLLLHLFNFIFKNIELSAFIFTNILLLLNFCSLYFVTARFFDKTVAQKTVWLFFLFPFSIFMRSFYAENLLLFLLIWFTYFLHFRRRFLAAVLLGLINISKGSVYLINVFYLLHYIFLFSRKKVTLLELIVYLILPVIGLFTWSLYTAAVTGNPLYFIQIGSAWYPTPLPYPPLLYNLLIIFLVRQLPLHTLHLSQLDVLSVVFSLWFLIKSKKHFLPLLWWIWLCLFLSPLLIRNLASFSRYQSLAFPLFLFLSLSLPKPIYFLILSIFIPALFVTSLFFVNWYWVG